MPKSSSADVGLEWGVKAIGLLEDRYGMEATGYPQRVISKFGGSVELYNSNGWLPEIVVYVPGIGNDRLRWGDQINDHPVIEHSAREYLIECIRTRSQLRVPEMFANEIGRLQIRLSDKEKEANQKIRDWIVGEVERTRDECEPLYSCIKQYVEFCVECEVWGFDESLIWMLEHREQWGKSGRANRSYRSGMLDPDQGPYNQEEIQEISSALQESDRISAAERALLLLCRDFGIRPIQIALLREDDFISDDRGIRLRIPRVKGMIRSGLRRMGGNFTERPVADELASALENLLGENEGRINRLDLSLQNRCRKEDRTFRKPPSPLFPREVLTDVAWGIYSQKQLWDYAYHRTNGNICRAIRDISGRLGVVCRRSHEPGALLQIGAYRFRRTKATSMVLQGYSPEDVAYALDHDSLSSIKHYFRFSRDLIDYVNLAAAGSAEISQLVSYWKGKFVEDSQPELRHVRVSRVGSLGLCLKDSICEHHPAVSCYSCPSFRPYRDANHAEALESIVKIRDEVADLSSGPVKQQLDLAIEMARQCISAQGGKNGDS